MERSERSKAYDDLYDKASEIINRLKPCAIQLNTEGKATAISESTAFRASKQEILGED